MAGKFLFFSNLLFLVKLNIVLQIPSGQRDKVRIQMQASPPVSTALAMTVIEGHTGFWDL